MPVPISEFLEQIGQGAAPRVVLFGPAAKAPWGKEDYEPYLVDRALEKLMAAYVDPSLQDMCYSMFYADETSPNDIALEARTFPFLAERRVIVVRNAERYNLMSGEKNSPMVHLLDYLEAPVDTTLLVLVAPVVDRRKRFYKACEKYGVVVECPQLEDPALAAWVRREARARDKELTQGALRELLDRAGGRMSDVHNALHLVASYVGNAPQVTDADVRAACADVAEESIWALTDAIAQSDPPKALAALHQLLDLNKAPDEILGTINWMLENAYRALPETEPKVAKQFVEKKVAPLARSFGLDKMKRALALCTKTNFMLRTTGVDRQLALELLVVKLAFNPAPKRRTG